MFDQPAVLSPVGSKNWKLLEELRYRTPRGDLIRIPKRFICDLASIPRLFRIFIGVNGKHRQAAIVHDWLYYKKGHAALRQFTREECDQIFYDAMIDCDVSEWKAYLMWAAVRLGGWIAWQR